MKKKQTMQEKRANELEALNNALNYHKTEVEEFNNAYIQVDERNKKRPYHLIFMTNDGKEIESSCECNYMEMNAFIQGVWRYKNMIEKLKNHTQKQIAQTKILLDFMLHLSFNYDIDHVIDCTKHRDIIDEYLKTI